MSGRHRFIRLLLTVIAVVLLGAALGACDEDSEGPEEGATTEEVGEGVGEDEDEIFADPESFVGEQVTVSGEISEQVVDDFRGFRISGGAAGDGLLVLAASPPGDLQSDDVVQVTGTVHRVDQDTFEEDFGFAFEEGFAEVEGEVAIAASNIQVLEEQGE